MSDLLLSDATIDATGQKVKEGVSTYHAVLACGWSDEFCARFAVQTPSDPMGKSPISRLNLGAVNFILTPFEAALRQHEVDVACGLIDKFQYVPRFDKDGHIRSRELHFHVSLNGLDEFVKVATYAASMGKGTATIKIVYNEDAQGDLDLEDGDESDDEQMSMDAASDEGEEQGGETLGDPRTEPEKKKRGRAAKGK